MRWLEDPGSYFAALAVLIDSQEITRHMLHSIRLNQNASQRLPADQVKNTLYRENVDSLTSRLQLLHQLVQGRDPKFLKGPVT